MFLGLGIWGKTAIRREKKTSGFVGKKKKVRGVMLNYGRQTRKRPQSKMERENIRVMVRRNWIGCKMEHVNRWP